MALPVFAPFPPPTIISTFPAEEWQQCLQAWSILAEAYVRASDKIFKSATDTASFGSFLLSFYEQWSSSGRATPTSISDLLKRQCLRLVRRCHQLGTQPELFSTLNFLSSLARAHLRSTELQDFLTEVWQSGERTTQRVLQKWRSCAVSGLETSAGGTIQPSLAVIMPLLYSCESMAAFILTGSDFLEAASTAYMADSRPAMRKNLVVVLFIGLTSLVKGSHANTAALSDHLYSLKAQAESSGHALNPLADLVTNTPLLKVIRKHTVDVSSGRMIKLVELLQTFRTPSIARKRKRDVDKSGKGKGRQLVAHDEIHIHRMSLVTQIQDLFPHLGTGFVLRLLDEYHDDVELVTAQLLDDSLPAHLAQLDRSEQGPMFGNDQQSAVDNLVPRSTPPIPESFIPHRANIFDGDDFDRLEFDTSKLHIGKRPDDVEEPVSANKAAILAALAAFDSDDDERDDTYDMEDVGGTVDTAHHDGDDTAIAMPIDDNDMILYRLYQSEPESFGRSAETRRSKPRGSLKAQTGLTDEIIEGWAIMLQRDPKRARRLALEAMRFDGKQNDVARTAYRGQTGDPDTEDSDVANDRGAYRGRGGGRGLGRGGRGRGRGGSVAGPSADASTAAAQRRKEANKSSRANHNRRDQRARKMARGGFVGAS